MDLKRVHMAKKKFHYHGNYYYYLTEINEPVGKPEEKAQDPPAEPAENDVNENQQDNG